MPRNRRQVIRGQGARARRGRRGGGRGGNAVGRFLAPRTGRQAGATANAMAGVEYNPQIRELRQRAKGSRKRLHDIGNWYQDLAGDYSDAMSRAEAAFSAAQAGTAARLSEAGARNTEAVKEMAANDAEFAKLVGGPTNAAGVATATEAAAALDRHRATLAQPLAGAGAASIGHLGTRRTSARMRGIEAKRDEHSRRDKILSDLSATRKEKGMARVAHKEKIREADRAERAQRVSERLAKREFTDPKPYDEAILAQAQMGLEGDRASAGAQLGAASIYAGADRRTAKATERAARQARRGREATARGQVKTAGIYGRNNDSGGYNKREAQALLSSAGKNFKNSQAAVNYLVNRGVKIGTARAAVNAALGGGGGKRRGGGNRRRARRRRGWGKSRIPR